MLQLKHHLICFALVLAVISCKSLDHSARSGEATLTSARSAELSKIQVCEYIFPTDDTEGAWYAGQYLIHIAGDRAVLTWTSKASGLVQTFEAECWIKSSEKIKVCTSDTESIRKEQPSKHLWQMEVSSERVPHQLTMKGLRISDTEISNRTFETLFSQVDCSLED
jgi:hypothetical protein